MTDDPVWYQDTLELDELHRSAPGTGYVASVDRKGTNWRLTLSYPGRRLVDVVVNVASGSPTLPPEIFGRPIAVQIRNNRGGLVCSVITASDSGPRSMPITVAQALALNARGVHTVVVTLAA